MDINRKSRKESHLDKQTKVGDIAYLTEAGVKHLSKYEKLQVGEMIVCHSDSDTSTTNSSHQTCHYFRIGEGLYILYSDHFTFDKPVKEKAEDSYLERAMRIGTLVDQKEKAYGSSVVRGNEVMKAFLAPYYKEDQGTYEFPEELLIHLQIMIRTIDKFNRIVNNPKQDLMEENTYNDIVGYGLIGAKITNR